MGRRKQTAPRSLRPPSNSTNLNDCQINNHSSQKKSCASNNWDIYSVSKLSKRQLGNEEITDDDSGENQKINKCTGFRTLKAHRRSLEAKNQFLVCQHCYKMFKHQKSLQRHLKLHSAIRKYKCAMCPSAFVRSDHLRSHTKSHFARSKKFRIKQKLIFALKEYGKELKVNVTCADEISFSSKNDLDPISPMTEPKVSQDCINCLRIKPESSPSSINKAEDEASTNITKDSLLTKSEEPISVPNTSSSESCLKSEKDSSNVIICPSCNLRLPDLPNFVWHMSCAHQHSLSVPSCSSHILEESQCQASAVSLRSPAASPELPKPSSTLLMPTICVFCGVLVPGPQAAVFHLVSHFMQSTKKQKCDKCPLETIDASQLQNHGLEKHCSVVYRCDICEDTFSSKDSFNQHYRSKHIEDTESASCILCRDAIFNDPSEIHDHMLSRHMKYYPSYASSSATVQTPSTSTNKASNIRAELNESYHEPRPFLSTVDRIDPAEVVGGFLTRMCHTCHRVFDDEMEVLKHQVEAHRIGDSEKRKTPSPVVKTGKEKSHFGDQYWSQDKVNQHHKNSSNQPQKSNSLSPILCSYCGKSYRSQSDLERHIFSAHFTSPHSLKCNICDQLFPNQGALQDHKENHKRAPTPIDQGVMGPVLPTSLSTLQSHCRLCGKVVCTDQNQLCSMCILTVSYLKQRLEPTQVTAPTYVCDQCGKVFESTFQLEMHTITHHVSDIQSTTSDQHNGKSSTILRPSRTTRFVKTPVPMKSGARAPCHDKRTSQSNVDQVGAGKFTCLVCDQLYTSEPDLIAHKQIHLKALRFGSGHRSCKEETILPVAKTFKLSKRSNSRFKCRNCYLQFKNWADMRLHKLLKHSKRKTYNSRSISK